MNTQLKKRVLVNHNEVVIATQKPRRGTATQHNQTAVAGQQPHQTITGNDDQPVASPQKPGRALATRLLTSSVVMTAVMLVPVVTGFLADSECDVLGCGVNHNQTLLSAW